MSIIKNWNHFNSLILENFNTENIKGNIEDILTDLKDSNLNLKTNIIYEEIHGMKFYEICIYSYTSFKRDKDINEVIRRVSKYLSEEYGNPLLDIVEFNINNNRFYRDEFDANKDYKDNLWKWYFGFIVNDSDGYYLKIPTFWHHNHAKKSYHHKIDPVFESNYSLTNTLSEQLKDLFEYVTVKGNNILCSNILDRGGNPYVRTDSKRYCKALMIKIDSKSIEIKSIVNTTGEKGFSTSVVDKIVQVLPDNFEIVISQDVSGGFWDKIISKYPNIRSEKS
jgi:hypothetical protein